jgi:fumarate reductase subunit C
MVNGTLTSEGHGYTDYHPRWLRRHVSTYWWLEKPAYLAFILRESTCLFVGWFAIYLLLLMNAVVDGPVAYQQFLAWSASPWMIVLNLVSFALMVFHAITFFGAAPQALVIHLGRTRVPGPLVLLGHYAAWAVVSAAVIWLLVRGA